MKKYFCLLIFIFFATGCFNPNNFYTKGEYFLLHQKKYQNENNLFLASYGINNSKTPSKTAQNKIYQFEVSYFSTNNLNLSECRKKIISCVEQFLKLINSNEELHPFLYKKFTTENLHFDITFFKENGEKVDDGFVTTCILFENKISYFIAPESLDSKSYYRETYEEALEKLKQER